MKKTAIYVAITFLVCWGIWIPAGLATGTFQTGIGSVFIMQIIVAASMFVPFIAALITNRIVPQDERLDLALHPHIKTNLRWYLFAWFVPAVLALAGSIVFFLVFPELFDTSLSYVYDLAKQAGAEIPDVDHSILIALTIASAVIYAPFINMLFAFGEEAGWRGMLYPALRERLQPIPAVLASGIIWGLWHAPIIAMGHNYGVSYAGFPWLGFVAMIVFCTSTSAILAYLRENSATVWTCALYHGAVNATANIALFFCATGASVFGPSTLGLVAVIPTFVLGIWYLLRLNANRAAMSEIER